MPHGVHVDLQVGERRGTLGTAWRSGLATGRPHARGSGMQTPVPGGRNAQGLQWQASLPAVPSLTIPESRPTCGEAFSKNTAVGRLCAGGALQPALGHTQGPRLISQPPITTPTLQLGKLRLSALHPWTVPQSQGESLGQPQEDAPPAPGALTVKAIADV